MPKAKTAPNTYIIRCNNREFLANGSDGKYFLTTDHRKAFQTVKSGAPLIVEAAKAQGLELYTVEALQYPPRTQVVYCRACETKYHGPTNSRGSRVSAKHFATGRKISLPWDHSLGVEANHTAVASILLGSWDLTICSIDGGGYVILAND